MGQSETRTNYDFHLAGGRLQESQCRRDLGIDIVPSLSPEHHIGRIVIKIYFKYIYEHGEFEHCLKHISDTENSVTRL